MTLAGSWSVVRGAHVQAFTFSSQDHGRLSAVLWCVVCCVCMRVLLCGVLRGVWCVVCVSGVLCWCWCWCCVVVWCVFLCFSIFLSDLFFLFLALTLSFFSLLSSLLSPLLATKHCGKNRPTNTASNFEAFECDLAHGRRAAVGPLPPPLSSPLPSLPPLLNKKAGSEEHGRLPDVHSSKHSPVSC